MAVSAKSLLQQTLVKDIIMDENNVVTVRGNESVVLGLALLIDNSITSVPVYDVHEDRYKSFLSFLDVCAHTLKIYNDPKIDLKDKSSDWKSATCSQVLFSFRGGHQRISVYIIHPEFLKHYLL